MKSLARASALIVLVVLVCACASTTQSVAIPDPAVTVQDLRMGRIYVMREPNFWRFNIVSLTRRIRVFDGAKEIGSIAGQRGYVSWEREPGAVALSVPGEALLNLTVEQGAVYYVLVHDKARGGGLTPGDGKLIVTLEQVDARRGQGVLAKATPPN